MWAQFKKWALGISFQLVGLCPCLPSCNSTSPASHLLQYEDSNAMLQQLRWNLLAPTTTFESEKCPLFIESSPTMDEKCTNWWLVVSPFSAGGSPRKLTSRFPIEHDHYLRLVLRLLCDADGAPPATTTWAEPFANPKRTFPPQTWRVVERSSLKWMKWMKHCKSIAPLNFVASNVFFCTQAMSIFASCSQPWIVLSVASQNVSLHTAF